MALNTARPTDTDVISIHAAYIRETRTSVNALAAGVSDVVQTVLNLAGGTTSLVVGTDISDSMLESIIVTAIGAVDIANITGGTAGQIKVIIPGDNNFTLSDNSVAIVGGVIRLNQIPASGEIDMVSGDVIGLVNIGGDAGVTSDGYWKEIYRTLYVG